MQALFALGRDHKAAQYPLHITAWDCSRTACFSAAPSSDSIHHHSRADFQIRCLSETSELVVKKGLQIMMSPPMDRNPLLGEGLLCPTKLELEEKETSAPIYGELGEERLGGRPPRLSPQPFRVTRSVSHIPHPSRTTPV